MNKYFVLIEMGAVDIVCARLFLTPEKADEEFDAIAAEHQLVEASSEELDNEAPGTLRLAGDDAYAVQLVAVEVE